MASGFVEKVSEKVSFTTKVPMLMKATSDNESPTPGYLYQEINKITFESVSNCKSLVDFLNDRLKKSSPHIKYKALKIMTYLSANGQSEFRSSLRHQSEPVRQAASFCGSINSLHGDALNQKVRQVATELIELLFNIENPESAQQSFIMAGPTGKKMDGFGNAPIQTTKSTTLLDSVKGLRSHITTFSGYLQPKQGLVFSGFNGETSSTSSSNAEPTSTVKFVNYDTWTEGTTDERLTRNIVSSPVDDDFSTSEEIKEEEDGKLESQLVDKITEEGGIRTVPSKRSLDEFSQKCKSLDVDKVLQFLNSKLDEPTLDIQMKSLFAMEHLLRTGLPDIADKVLLNCVSLQHVVDTETGKLQSKANKVLCTAKSQSAGLQQHATNFPEATSDTSYKGPTSEISGNLIDGLFNDGLSHATTKPPQQEHLDIFQGLQIRQETKQSTENQLELNNLDLLDICDENKQHKNGINSNAEVFDPLDMGHSKTTTTGTNNINGSMLSILVDEKPLKSNAECINSSFHPPKKTVNPVDLFSQQDRSKAKDSDFSDLLSFGQNQSCLTSQPSLTDQSSSTSQTSLTSQSSLTSKPNLTNQSSLTSLSGLTSQSCLTSQPNSVGQSNLTSQTSLASQTGFGSGNSMLQSLLMSKTSQQSTIPLNLSKPSSKKTDFDFLSKSKRENAFSFVQDEMKASKK